MLKGNMNLELYYKDAKKHSSSLKGVLVIWVATNDIDETRIVGWYKNATVYSVQQYQHAITNDKFDFCYHIKADAKDCYLLPENQRTFRIQRAAVSGKGTGMGRSNVWYAESSFAQTELIPKVTEYIDSYCGTFVNTVFTDEILGKGVKDDTVNDYQKLFNERVICLEKNDKLGALKYLNTARQIKETPDVLISIAHTLTSLSCFDKAISIYEKVTELEGNKVDTIHGLMECYDYMGNREKTLEYCDKAILLLGDSEEDISDKIYYS